MFPLSLELQHTFDHALIMANIVRRMLLGSNSSSGSTKKIVRSREDIIHEDYLEWKISNEKLENIYSIGTFDFNAICQEDTDHLIIHGFFTFHSNCQEDFPIWFYEWWHSYDPQQIFYHQQYSKASILTYSKPKDYTMSRQYSSTENSRFHGFSVGVTELLNIIVLPTNFL